MWRVVFLGKVLLPLDTVLLMEPWRSEAPQLSEPVWNPIITDAVWQIYPLVSAAKELRHGGNYFWDPYSMAGMPSLARGEIFAHPLIVPLSQFLSVGTTMSWAAVLSLLIGGSFTYLLLRELSCGPFGSVVGSLAFVLNGYLVGWLTLPNMTGCMVWLPSIAWGIERAIRLRDWRWTLAGAFGFAMQILSGSLLWSLYGAITLGLLLTCRAGSLALSERKLTAGARPLMYGGMTFALGAGLAAVPLLLSAQLYLHSNRTSQAGARSALKPMWHAIRLLAPNLYGNSLHGESYRSAFNYVETNLYFGILPLFFILAGVIAGRRSLTWPLFGLGTAALLAVYNIPPFRQLIAWIYPVFLNTFPGRIFYVVVFCWSLVAGLGADWLVKQHPRRLLRGLGTSGLLCALALLALAGGAMYVRSRPPQELVASAFCPLRGFSVGSLSLAIGLVLSASMIFWLWGYSKAPSGWIQGIVLLVLIADLFVAGSGFNPALDESVAFPETPSLKALRALEAGVVSPSRIATVPSGRILYGMAPELYGLHSVSGYSSWALKRYARYIHLSQPVTTPNHIFLTTCCSPLLDAVNAKYIYTPKGVELENPENFELVHDGAVRIYENNAAFPRAWVVHRVISAQPGDLDGVGERLLTAGFSPAREAVVEADRELTGNHEPPGVQSSAEIVRHEPERVIIETQLSQEGLLVLSDAMYPGWKAYIDDRPAPIYYTNLFMRGVFVGAGDHRVEFVYRSNVLPVGLAVSASTILLVIGVTARAWFQGAA